MSTALRWTSADLEALPDDGKYYEIINGELHVSKQPHWHHQAVCGQAFALLHSWSKQTRAGFANIAPGVLFADNEDVAPDVVWVSSVRLNTALAEDGKLHAAPDLAVEVLSPGLKNERRDREAKLKLYSQRGVHEYWIIDWRKRQVEVYRRASGALQLVATLFEADILQSPLLPGFSCKVEELFEHLPNTGPA